MKKVFTGDDEEEVDQMIEGAKEYYFLPILLDQTTNSLTKYLSTHAYCPLITDKRFTNLLDERYGLSTLEKKLVEKHLFRNDMLKYTKSTIEGKDYKKEYNVLII